jgi:hypothetical protein
MTSSSKDYFVAREAKEKRKKKVLAIISVVSLYSRIVLDPDNKEFINQVGLEQFPSYSLEEFSNHHISTLPVL